jgi:hypothetical protein
MGYAKSGLGLCPSSSSASTVQRPDLRTPWRFLRRECPSRQEASERGVQVQSRAWFARPADEPRPVVDTTRSHAAEHELDYRYAGTDDGTRAPAHPLTLNGLFTIESAQLV